jgi:hypothetical protein
MASVIMSLSMSSRTQKLDVRSWLLAPVWFLPECHVGLGGAEADFGRYGMLRVVSRASMNGGAETPQCPSSSSTSGLTLIVILIVISLSCGSVCVMRERYRLRAHAWRTLAEACRRATAVLLNVDCANQGVAEPYQQLIFEYIRPLKASSLAMQASWWPIHQVDGSLLSLNQQPIPNWAYGGKKSMSASRSSLRHHQAAWPLQPLHNIWRAASCRLSTPVGFVHALPA